METNEKSRYASLACFVTNDLSQIFIDECKEAGLNASELRCFSLGSSISKNIAIIYERGQKYAPLILRVLDMLLRKNSINIEIQNDRKIINLRGVSTEDALRLIEAASAIKISNIESEETKDTNKTHPPVSDF